MQWIDGEGLSVGTIGFLVETTNTNHGSESYGLYERPCHTNQSREPRLTGWCGETNNVSRTAQGLAKVVRVANNGRVQIVTVDGAEGAAWLNDVAGYPDLVPDEWDKAEA
jgi:hypothetical protein